MKELFFQKSNFRCRENIYICRPLRRLRRLAIEYVKNSRRQKMNLNVHVHCSIIGCNGYPLLKNVSI